MSRSGGAGRYPDSPGRRPPSPTRARLTKRSQAETRDRSGKGGGYLELDYHRLMKREPVRLGEQSLQKCFMAVFLLIRAANMFLVFIFTANWVL